jgi:hypothetical protein
LQTLKDELQSFQLQLAVRDARSQETELFQTWTAILSAKSSIEKAKEKPIRYKSYRVEGIRIIFVADQVPTGELLDQARLVKDDDMVLVTGSIEAISGSYITFRVLKWYSKQIPPTRPFGDRRTNPHPSQLKHQMQFA